MIRKLKNTRHKRPFDPNYVTVFIYQEADGNFNKYFITLEKFVAMAKQRAIARITRQKNCLEQFFSLKASVARRKHLRAHNCHASASL